MLRLRFLRAEKPPLSPESRYSTILTSEGQMQYRVRDFGTKMQIIPTVVYATLYEDKARSDFNPFKRTPSLGSNIYPRYAGRSDQWKWLNYFPGLHVSILGVESKIEETANSAFPDDTSPR